MDSPSLALLLIFLFLLALHVPVAVALAVATFAAAWLAMGSFEVVAATLAQRMATGVSSFSLLAIPFFVLSGLLMGQGGIARRLVDLATALVGRLPGGLALVNVLTCLLFGAVSGSATAAVSSIGGFMIPELVRKGYDRDFSAALNISAATTGLLIPPSNIMIVYALAAGGSVSIAALFLAGVLPGILFGVLLMVACGWISWRRGYAGAGTVSWRELGRAARGAFLSLLLVVIVLGGILAGIFTATEAAAVAVLYAFLLSVIWYRSVPWRALPRILLRAGITTAVIYLLIATSMALSWILALEEVPQRFSGFLPGLSDHPVVILLLINVLLLLVGTFMDMTPAVLIFTPILGPVAVRCGMDPVHFGIMMIANLCIGLCTPPVGTCLFVGCGVGDTTIARVTPRLLPLYAAMITGLLLVTYLPGLSLALPRLAGLK